MRAALVVGMALAFCGQVALAQGGAKVDERRLRGAFEDRLKDAESARFRAIKQGPPKDGAWTLCGEVNAKNSYGGYSGFEPFLAVAGKDGKEPVSYTVIGVGETSGEVCAEKQLR